MRQGHQGCSRASGGAPLLPAPSPLPSLSPLGVFRFGGSLTPTPSPSSPQPTPHGDHERRGGEEGQAAPPASALALSPQQPSHPVPGPDQNVPSTWILSTCRSRSDMWENLQLGPKSHRPARGRQLLAALAERAPLEAEGHWRFRGKTLGTREQQTLLSGPALTSSQGNLSAPSFPLSTRPRLGVKPP